VISSRDVAAQKCPGGSRDARASPDRFGSRGVPAQREGDRGERASRKGGGGGRASSRRSQGETGCLTLAVACRGR